MQYLEEKNMTMQYSQKEEILFVYLQYGFKTANSVLLNAVRVLFV